MLLLFISSFFLDSVNLLGESGSMQVNSCFLFGNQPHYDFRDPKHFCFHSSLLALNNKAEKGRKGMSEEGGGEMKREGIQFNIHRER